MKKLLLRILLAVVIANVLSIAGVKGNAVVLQTLFTVLGIVFSISMSLLVSFNLSKVLNQSLRKELRGSIIHSRNMLLWDFSVSTIFLFTALIWDQNNFRYEIAKWCIIDIMLISVSFVMISLIYEIYNFKRLHELNCDIEDEVINEEIKKRNNHQNN